MNRDRKPKRTPIHFLALAGLLVAVVGRAKADFTFGRPQNMGPVINSSSADVTPCFSADNLELYFTSIRPGGFGGGDLWVSTRQSMNDPWGPPVNLGPWINTSEHEGGAAISTDGRMLHFFSSRQGGLGWYDLWEAAIIPVVDFNGDGKVDIQDLLRLVESWGKDDPSVDMGPMAWGDGKVDEKDLEVLMRYWGQEVNDPTLVAYWKLDETSGTVAADSAGTHDGILVGHPTWEPAGGKIGGALQFNGTSDTVTAGFVCDPSKGPFSIFAWVQGGGPGQVILSQQAGANWLMAAAPQGSLKTELKGIGRFGSPLASPSVITDGAWHRVGLVWDGQIRILYVDDVEVARDASSSPAASAGGLNIGAAGNLAPGTFWSGLIDDVRIYNRAVKP